MRALLPSIMRAIDCVGEHVPFAVTMVTIGPGGLVSEDLLTAEPNANQSRSRGDA